MLCQAICHRACSSGQHERLTSRSWALPCGRSHEGMQAWQARISPPKHTGRMGLHAPIKGMEYPSMNRPIAGKVCSNALSLQTL